MKRTLFKGRSAIGNSLAEYLLPLIFFIVGGLGISLIIDMPEILSLFFQNSVSADINGTTAHIQPLGTLPETTSSRGIEEAEE